MTDWELRQSRLACLKTVRFMQREKQIEDPRDARQELFTAILENRLLDKYDPKRKAKLQTFLILALKQVFIRKYFAKKRAKIVRLPEDPNLISTCWVDRPIADAVEGLEYWTPKRMAKKGLTSFGEKKNIRDIRKTG